MKALDKLLKLSGDTTYTRALAHTDKERTYDKDSLLVGERLVKFEFNSITKAWDIPIVRNYYLDLKNGVRLLIIGLIGSGKTFFIRALIERLFKTGKYAVASIPDVKHEMWSSVYPAPPKQFQRYAHGEKPRGIPVVTFRPTFFRSFKKLSFREDKWHKALGFRFQDISYADIVDIFDLEELKKAPLQHAFVEDLGLSIQQGELKLESLEQLEELIEAEDSLTPQSKAGLKRKTSKYFKIGFFNPPYYDPINVLNKGYLFALDMEQFKDVDPNGGPPFTAVSVTQRLLVNGLIEGRLKFERLFIILDEAARFLPKDRPTAVKLMIEEDNELLRSYGVNYAFCYQTWAKVPPSFVENSKYLIVPRNASIDVFLEIYKSTGIFKGPANQLRTHVSRIVSKMKRFDPFSWLVINRDNGQEDIVRWNSPMSMHDTKDKALNKKIAKVTS